MMKYNSSQMALAIITQNPGKCTLLSNDDSKFFIRCSDPKALEIPQSSEEQWYLLESENRICFTNKDSTKSGIYDSIPVVISN